MSVLEKIGEDLKQAMKNKEELRVSALRMMRTEIVKKQKDKPGGKISEEEIIGVLQSMIRRHQESIEQFHRGGREDLVSKEAAQLKVIETYLPEKLPKEEIKKVIAGVIKEVGAMSPRDLGKVMGKVMPRLKESGKLVDGKEVNELVRSALMEMEQG